MSLLWIDLKRLFAGKGLLVLALLSPLLAIFLFSLLLAPMIWTAKDLSMRIVLFNEDSSRDVDRFIQTILFSPQFEGLKTVYDVDDLQTGYRWLEEDLASVLVHVPEGLFDRLSQGQTVTIDLISQEQHAFEAALIQLTLSHSLRSVGSTQNQIELARQLLLDQALSEPAADRFHDRLTAFLLMRFVGRQGVIGEKGVVSALGDFLPADVYLVALYVFFASLTLLPLIQLSAHDLSSGLVDRGLLRGRGLTRFFLVRLLSGSLLVCLVFLLLFPASRLLSSLHDTAGKATSHAGAFVLATCLCALAFSALSLLLASAFRAEKTALWLAFYLCLLMGLSGGLLLPDTQLPAFLAVLTRFLPFQGGLQLLANAAYAFDPGRFISDLWRLGLLSTSYGLIAYLAFRMRAVRP